jgi:hypothetical protein
MYYSAGDVVINYEVVGLGPGTGYPSLLVFKNTSSSWINFFGLVWIAVEEARGAGF